MQNSGPSQRSLVCLKMPIRPLRGVICVCDIPGTTKHPLTLILIKHILTLTLTLRAAFCTCYTFFLVPGQALCPPWLTHVCFGGPGGATQTEHGSSRTEHAPLSMLGGLKFYATTVGSSSLQGRGHPPRPLPLVSSHPGGHWDRGGKSSCGLGHSTVCSSLSTLSFQRLS